MIFNGERFIPQQTYGEIEIEHLQRYDAVVEQLQGKVVLDAACGEGYGTNMIADFAQKVYGVDVSLEAVQNARDKYKKENIEFICASVSQIPLENHLADIIISFETLEHLPEDDQNQFMNEILRVLKPDGILIISTPDKLIYSDIPNYDNEFHIKEFSFTEFDMFIQKNFKKMQYYGQGVTEISLISQFGATEATNIKRYNTEYPIIQNARYIIAQCSNNENGQFLNIESMSSSGRIYTFFNKSRLYYSSNEDFISDQCVVADLNYNNKLDFSVRFDQIPKDEIIQYLRWDPIEGMFCHIFIDAIFSNTDEKLELIPLNHSKKIDEGYTFYTKDPMFKIEGNFDKINSIEIKGRFVVPDIHELSECMEINLSKLEDEITEKYRYSYENEILLQENKKSNKIKEVLQEHIEQLNKDNGHFYHINASLEQEKQSFITEKFQLLENVMQLQNEKTQLQDEKMILQQDKVMLQEEKMQLQENEALLNKERAELQEEKMLLNDNNSLLEEEIRLKEEFVVKLNLDINQIQNEKNHIYLQSLQLEQDKNSILNSTSWKIMKPFRVIINWLKKKLIRKM